MVARYTPERGDIAFVDFDPIAGCELAKPRPALVLSRGIFSKKVKLAFVAPVTSTVREHKFEIKLDKRTKTGGAVLCHQVRTVDYRARAFKFLEKAPKDIVEAALKKVRLITS